MSSVKATLLQLGTGAVLQRLCQLAAIALIARTLGAAGTGAYAMGIAAGATLAVLAGAGIRNLVTREVARAPDAVGPWVRTAVRLRLLLGLLLLVLALPAVLLCTGHPLFWTLCCLQVLPAAFDSKGLLDAARRTRAEVLLESGAAALHLLLVAWWSTADGSLETLAALHLLSRCAYAAGAAASIRRLPAPALAVTPSLRSMLRSAAGVSVAQTASEVVLAADAWLVGLLVGPGPAGLYAVAQRLAGAAGLPSTQVTRLLLPHLHRASLAGDPARTLRTALVATSWGTLPLLAGGLVVAEPLCALFGPGFTAAGPTLGFLLLAMTCQHLGWQGSHALFALDRDAAYARTLALPAILHLGLLPGLVLLLGAAGAGLSAALAQLVYAVAVLGAVHRRQPLHLGGAILPPLGAALLTAAAALWLQNLLPHVAPPLLPVLAGALAAFGCLWLFELRGRWGRIGEGLSTASGFGGSG